MEKSRILELAMGGIYFFSGLSKLLPIPSLVEQFDQFAEHFPFGLKPPGWLFLRRWMTHKMILRNEVVNLAQEWKTRTLIFSIGVAEVIGGFCLLRRCSPLVKTVAASSMMVIMVGAWHILYAVGEDPAMFVPSVVCFGILAYMLSTNHWDEKPKEE